MSTAHAIRYAQFDHAWLENQAIQGKTDEKTAIQINGKEIPHSEKGLFEADITLSQGINALTFTATKRHGKSTSETRHVIYKKQK